MTLGKTLGCVALMGLWIACPTRAGIVLAPDAPVAGHSQAELSAKWWQWALSHPNGANPVQDTTGAFSHLGDQGDYFFLAGSFSQTLTTRTVTVPAGKPLYFPLTNIVSIIPLFGDTEAAVRADASDDVGVVTNLTVKLNGVEQLPAAGFSPGDYRQKSPPGLFDLEFIPNNIYGLDPAVLEAVSDGYWAATSGLAPGEYDLTFGSHSVGTGPYAGQAFDQSLAYRVTVVPLPSAAWASLLVLPIGLFVYRRHQRLARCEA